MALIIEDGTGVVGANSYVTIDEARAYALSRLIDLPSADSELEALLISGYDFLNFYEGQFVGIRVFPLVQTGPWPRSEVTLYGVPFPQEDIPAAVKTAQIQAAVAAGQGVELFPSKTGAAISREKVGPLETEYAVATWDAASFPVLSNVESTLASLFYSGSLVTTVRI